MRGSVVAGNLLSQRVTLLFELGHVLIVFVVDTLVHQERFHHLQTFLKVVVVQMINDGGNDVIVHPGRGRKGLVNVGRRLGESGGHRCLGKGGRRRKGLCGRGDHSDEGKEKGNTHLDGLSFVLDK